MEDVFNDVHKIAGSWRPNQMATNIYGKLYTSKVTNP